MAEKSTTATPYGQEPKASPAVRFATVFLALLLLALAFVAGREVWRITAAPSAESWTQPAIDVMSQDHLEQWMVFAGVGAVILGLLCLIVAFKPRRTTHVAFSKEGYPSTWIRHVDIARRASAVARQVPGVTSAQTVSKPSGVSITVNGDVGDPGLKARVEQSVAAELGHLSKAPKVSVHTEKLQGVNKNV